MSYRFQDNHICPRCGQEFSWVWTASDKGEYIPLDYDRDRRHVKNCTRILNSTRYSIELECPYCYKREFVEKSR